MLKIATKPDLVERGSGSIPQSVDQPLRAVQPRLADLDLSLVYESLADRGNRPPISQLVP